MCKKICSSFQFVLTLLPSLVSLFPEDLTLQLTRNARVHGEQGSKGNEYATDDARRHGERIP